MPVTNAESFSLTFKFENITTTTTCERFTAGGKNIVRVPVNEKKVLKIYVYPLRKLYTNAVFFLIK